MLIKREVIFYLINCLRSYGLNMFTYILLTPELSIFISPTFMNCDNFILSMLNIYVLMPSKKKYQYTYCIYENFFFKVARYVI